MYLEPLIFSYFLIQRNLPQEWRYWLVNFIAIFSRLDHGFGSIKEIFFAYLGNKNQMHRLLYFLDFFGHSDHGSTTMEFFSFSSCSGHMIGPLCFLAFLGGVNLIFKPLDSQTWTCGFYRIFESSWSHIRTSKYSRIIRNLNQRSRPVYFWYFLDFLGHSHHESTVVEFSHF